MERAATRHEALCKTVEESLSRGGKMVLRARGMSMRPTIRDGEDVRLRPLGGSPPCVGEIVLARTPRGAALHRVIAVAHRSAIVRLKGDGLRSADAYLPLCALLGRADAVRRRDRWVRIDTPWRRRLGLLISLYLSPRAPLRTLARRLVRAGSL